MPPDQTIEPEPEEREETTPPQGVKLVRELRRLVRDLLLLLVVLSQEFQVHLQHVQSDCLSSAQMRRRSLPRPL